MKRHVSFIIVFIFITVNIITCYSDENVGADFSVTVDNDTRTVRISGTANVQPDNDVAIVVINPYKSIDTALPDVDASIDTRLDNIAAAVLQTKVNNDKSFSEQFILDESAFSGEYTVQLTVFNLSNGQLEKKFTFLNNAKIKEAEDALKVDVDMHSYINTYLPYIDYDKNNVYSCLENDIKDYIANQINDITNFDTLLSKAFSKVSIFQNLLESSKEDTINESTINVLKDNAELLDIINQCNEFNSLIQKRQDVAIKEFGKSMKNAKTPADIPTILSEAITKAKKYTQPTTGGGGVGGGKKGGSTTAKLSISGETALVGTDNMLPPPVETGAFDDLSDVEWAVTAINTLNKKGVFKGKTERAFCPNDLITREEFIKLLVDAFELELDQSSTSKYKDVIADEWYAPYIATAVKNSLVKGVSATEFGVGQPILRQDIMCLIYKALNTDPMMQVNEVDSDVFFTDSDEIDQYALNAVYNLARANIVVGNEDGGFHPKSGATRAEAAQMIYKVLYK